MKRKMIGTRYLRYGAVALALVLGVLAGCKSASSPQRTDQQIAADVQSKINGESALAGQNIQVAVQNGVATLSGTVSDEASRALAGNDSGTIAGVKTVVNNLTVQPPQQAAAEPPAPAPAPARDRGSRRDRAPAQQQQQARPTSGTQDAVPQPTPTASVPPAPVRPATKTITLPVGTIIPVRLTETLDSGKNVANEAFHGSLASDLGSQGVIAIPRGSPVMGRIVDVREAAHFKGNSMLSIELTNLTTRGQRVSVVTDPFSKEGAARGKNTAAKAGGGAALGALIGGLAGGGKGALIGGLAGGGAGAGVNAVTRGQQTVLPTETVVNFQLRSPITVTVPLSDGKESADVLDPQLQHR